MLGCEFLGFGHQVQDLGHEAVPAAVAGCIMQAQRGRDSKVPQSSQVNTRFLMQEKHAPPRQFIVYTNVQVDAQE